jgi:hypothetical protein
MHPTRKKVCLVSIMLTFAAATYSQITVNTIPSAVPFLIINSDSRSAGMGGAGIALTPDVNGAQPNGAKMAFIKQDFGVGSSFTPWLTLLQGHIYLISFTGFYKIKDAQTIHTSLRYLSLEQPDYNGNTIMRSNQFFYDAGYARRLNDIISIDATIRFIYSGTHPNAGTNTEVFKPNLAGAIDISTFLDKIWGEKHNSNHRHELLWGLCISNVGNKMIYMSNVNKDFLPANLGIGFGYKIHLDPKDNNTVGIYAAFNKLLVPTPNQAVGGSIASPNGYEYSSRQASESPITGLITSFYDAPGGAIQEFKSISEQIGAEYWYKKMFAIRTGFFYQDPEGGGREFMTVGTGAKYSVAALHFSYNIPVNKHNSLDNSFSFSLAFEFNKGLLIKKKTVHLS